MMALIFFAVLLVGVLYSAAAGLSFLCFEEWLEWMSLDNGTLTIMACMWPLTMPITLFAAVGVLTAGRLATWRTARRLPTARTFRG